MIQFLAFPFGLVENAGTDCGLRINLADKFLRIKIADKFCG